MKLVNYEYDLNCDINVGLNYLIVENVKLFRSIIEDLRYQLLNDAGKYILSEGNHDLDMHKMCQLITDPFDLKINTTVGLKKIYSELKSMTEEDFYGNILTLQGEINQFVRSLINEYEIELEYDDAFDFIKLIKAIDLKIAGDDESFLEKIAIYMKTMSHIQGVKCFFCVNLSTYLEEDELMELKKECLYNEYMVVLIENKCYNNDVDKILVIDNDLCRVI